MRQLPNALTLVYSKLNQAAMITKKIILQGIQFDEMTKQVIQACWAVNFVTFHASSYTNF